MTTPLAVLALVAAIGMVALLGGVVYQMLPESVCVRDHALVKTYRGTTERMPLAGVSQINYHYHAVVGFAGVWEFVDDDAHSLSVGAEAKGMKDVLASLEQILPGFSLADLERKVREGDVEGTIDVWRPVSP